MHSNKERRESWQDAGSDGPKMSTGKHGVFFTISTLFLLLSLVTVATVFVNVGQEDDLRSIQATAAARLRYISDDITSKFVSDLLPIRVSAISRSPSAVTVTFSDTIQLKDLRDYDDRMDTYETFIEGIYADKHHLNITLENFTANISIAPYNSVLDLDTNDLFVWNNASAVTDITVQLKFTEQNPGFDTSTTTAGSTNIRIIVLNDDDQVKSDTTTAVDATSNNNWTYKSGGDELIVVRFGAFSGYPDATLHVDPVVYTEVQSLSLAYSPMIEKTVLTAGEIRLVSAFSNFSLYQEILLIEE